MSSKNSTARKAKSKRAREVAADAIPPPRILSEEDILEQTFGPLVVKEDDRRKFISPKEINALIRTYGTKLHETCEDEACKKNLHYGNMTLVQQLAENTVAMRKLAAAQGKECPAPMYPVLDSTKFNPRTGAVQVISTSYPKPFLLPFPGKRLLAAMEEGRRQFKAVLALLPVIPVPVYTSKFSLLGHGLSWAFVSNSFDVYRFYMAIVSILRTAADVISPEMRVKALVDLDVDQKKSLAMFDDAFEVRIMSQMHLEVGTQTGRQFYRITTAALFEYEKMLHELTVSLLIAYENYIFTFFDQANQLPMPTLGSDITQFSQLVEEYNEEERKAKEPKRERFKPGESIQGIPTECLGDLYTRSELPDREKHCKEITLAEMKEETIGVIHVRDALLKERSVFRVVLLEDEGNVELKMRWHAPEYLLSTIAWYVSTENMEERIAQIVANYEAKQAETLAKEGYSVEPPALSTESDLSTDLERMVKITGADTQNRVAVARKTVDDGIAVIEERQHLLKKAAKEASKTRASVK
jgi:hypothetical protein